MSDEQKSEQDGPEVAYPNSNPHARRGPLEEDHSDPIEKQVEPGFVVTPGTETTEERRAIADERRSELGFDKPADEAVGDDPGESDDDDEDGDEPELTDESNDEEPKLPADDSPVHGESTIKEGSTDPTL